MITRTPSRLLDATPEQADWQRELARAISSPDELLRLLDLDPGRLPLSPARIDGFPLRVTRFFVSLMRKGDPDDPLLRQVIPLAREYDSVDGFVDDPVGDHAADCDAGILRKYDGRVLLITTGACAIHCRYCFRRHYPYAENNSLRHWPAMLEQLAGMTDISEVILSGGDPLTLSDRRLAELVAELDRIPNLRRLRIHSRLPIVLPERLTTTLTATLAQSRLACSVVLHANHPQELSSRLADALLPLRHSGVTLLNQSVLLKEINDDADTLVELSERLFDMGILPYYLHLLDAVRGAAHFAAEPGLERRLQTALLDRLPGYLVPRIVREQAGMPSKTPLALL